MVACSIQVFSLPPLTASSRCWKNCLSQSINNLALEMSPAMNSLGCVLSMGLCKRGSHDFPLACCGNKHVKITCLRWLVD
jgi:hypothetical protein